MADWFRRLADVPGPRGQPGARLFDGTGIGNLSCRKVDANHVCSALSELAREPTLTTAEIEPPLAANVAPGRSKVSDQDLVAAGHLNAAPHCSGSSV